MAAAGRLRASISEYNEPYDGKTKPVVAYAGGVFRLEPNPELYEGVRFVWIFVDPNPASTKGTFEPFTLTDLRLVSRVKPVNYAGQFASSDPVLTSAWYTGAYGSRLNMEDNAFNSILMERGDRVSIQGDGHPAMAAALSNLREFVLTLRVLGSYTKGTTRTVQVHERFTASSISDLLCGGAI